MMSQIRLFLSISESFSKVKLDQSLKQMAWPLRLLSSLN